MRTRLFAGAAAAIMAATATAPGALVADAMAADLALKAPPPAPSAWNWDGFYLGIHAGASAGRTTFSDPLGPSIFGDKVNTPGFLGGGQVGYNWQLPRSPWVFGVEADVSAMSASGSNTCLAASGNVIPSNCRVDQDATGTITGRIGYAGGPDGHTLYYVKGGAAWLNERIAMAISHELPINIPLDASATSSTLTRWGGTVGVGIEHALTPAWSVKFEYDYLNFGGSNVAAPDVLTETSASLVTSHLRGISTSVSNDAHEAKIGLNYRFGADPWATWNQALAYGAYPVKAVPAPVAQG